MVKKIIIEPENAWDFCQENRAKFKTTMFEVARNEEFGIAIYLTENIKGGCCVIVEADNVQIYTENIVSASDAEKTLKRVYDKYLADNLPSTLSDEFSDDALSRLEQEDEIEEREMELDYAVYEFMISAIGEGEVLDNKKINDILDDCKEHFLEYIARKHKLADKIFRPMILEDEDGEEFYDEYPYECMEFDDKDNPIYK